MTVISGNAYVPGMQSGAAQIGTAASGGFGTMQSSTLESSTVDLATELTSMIAAQNNYQAALEGVYDWVAAPSSPDQPRQVSYGGGKVVMSLSAALDGAISGLSVASAQISVVSRNIANQSNANASRKIANVVTVNGLPTVTSVSRASDEALLRNLLAANGDQAQQSAISDSLTRLESTLGTSTNNQRRPPRS